MRKLDLSLIPAILTVKNLSKRSCPIVISTGSIRQNVPIEPGGEVDFYVQSSSELFSYLAQESDNLVMTYKAADQGFVECIADGEYDEETKSIILHLKNGNNIVIPVEGLTEGLVTSTQLDQILGSLEASAVDKTGKFSANLTPAAAKTYSVGGRTKPIKTVHSCEYKYDILVNDDYVAFEPIEVSHNQGKSTVHITGEDSISLYSPTQNGNNGQIKLCAPIRVPGFTVDFSALTADEKQDLINRGYGQYSLPSNASDLLGIQHLEANTIIVNNFTASSTINGKGGLDVDEEASIGGSLSVGNDGKFSKALRCEGTLATNGDTKTHHIIPNDDTKYTDRDSTGATITYVPDGRWDIGRKGKRYKSIHAKQGHFSEYVKFYDSTGTTEQAKLSWTDSYVRTTAKNIQVKNSQGTGYVNLLKNEKLQVTILTTDWTDNEVVVTVEGVTADSTVIVGPSNSSYTAYGEAGVRCVAQDTDTLTFQCESAPDEDITIQILLLS